MLFIKNPYIIYIINKIKKEKLVERKVFVANYAGHDLSSATKYGRLEFLTEGRHINIFDTDGLLLELRHKLQNAKENDFLLLSGSPVINSLATMIIFLKFGVINYLIFNSKSRQYVARTITEIQIQGVV